MLSLSFVARIWTLQIGNNVAVLSQLPPSGFCGRGLTMGMTICDAWVGFCLDSYYSFAIH